MNEFDIWDAIGSVDEALLSRAEHQPTQKLPLRRFAIAVAAVMALATTVLAAPFLMELLFPTEVVQLEEGHRKIYGNLYRDIGQAEYRIDLAVEGDSLPQTIEQVCLPHCMIENNWLVAYGEVNAIYSEGPVHFKWWDRETPKWVTFEQLCIPAGGVSFQIKTYPGAQLHKETLTCDDVTIEYYKIPAYTNPETYEFYPEVTAVYWSDGEYAYHLGCSSDMTEEEVAEIVMSVAPVEDVTPYLKDDPNNDGPFIEGPPLDVHRMPTFVPDGYDLKVCDNDGWAATWIWVNDAGDTIGFYEAHENVTSDVTAREAHLEEWNCIREDVSVGDVTVYTYRYPNACELLWEDGDYCDLTLAEGFQVPIGHSYYLRAGGDDAVTMDVLLTMMKSVREISDISEYLTE